MNKKSIRDVDFHDKRVLVRVDFNVPVAPDANGKSNDDTIVTDDTRIRAALPTLEYILEQNPRQLVLLTHLGRPKGKVDPLMSVRPIVPILSDYLGEEVLLCGDIVGKYAEDFMSKVPDGAIVLMQNTRYYPGETKNDPEYAATLAQYGDIFVNDAFGTAHRAHASNVGISEHLESVAGFLLEKEIEFLSDVISEPERPYVAIMGGAKVSDKVGVIRALVEKVDYLIVGGGIGITFLKANGAEVAKSLVDHDSIPLAEELLTEFGDKIVLPTEVVIADDFKNDANTQTIDITRESVPKDWEILDIGPGSLDRIADVLADARTVVWNGPVGVFEMPTFAKGTFAIADMLAELTDQGATTVIGGGDSASAVEKSGLADRMTHISTGGGASLEMLEGKELPGVIALSDK